MPTAAAKSPAEALAVDALIIGGGIAGLWILHELRKAGRSAALVEAYELGRGQSSCAQGIIHGGLKYALGGIAGRDARQIAQMPDIWREAYGSESSQALAGACILSPHTWLWRSDSLKARIGMLGAKLGLQTRPEAVTTEERPALLRNQPGDVLRVAEPVFEVRSVLQTLADANSEFIVKIDGPEGVELLSEQGRVNQAILRGNGQELTLLPNVVILTAGTGNEALRKHLGLDPASAQRRPLHMTLVKGKLPQFFGHCIDGNKTRVTISSSAQDPGGQVTWQLGGELSEAGVELSEEDLIQRAQDELHAVLPSLQQNELAWSSYRVDRAEEATPSGRRPEDVSIIEDGDGHTLSCWPSKLALAPRLAQAVLGRVNQHHNSPELSLGLAPFARPHVAPFPWDREFTTQ